MRSRNSSVVTEGVSRRGSLGQRSAAGRWVTRARLAAPWLLVAWLGCQVEGPATRCETRADCPSCYACDELRHFCYWSPERCADETPDAGGRRADVGEDACVPARCASLGVACGSWPDGCGGSVDCGGCAFPDRCGGAGVAGACGHQAWFEVAGSDFGLWGDTVSWPSSAGGGVSASAWVSLDPALAIHAATGRVAVAWQEHRQPTFESDYRLALRAFDGEVWSGLGLRERTLDLSGAGMKLCVNLALDPVTGRPWVAWLDGNSPKHVYVLQHDGASWLEAGSDSASAGGVSVGCSNTQSPSLIVGADGSPVVAWGCFNDRYSVYARRFDGERWQELSAGSASGAGVSQESEDAYDPSLAECRGGQPSVLWTQARGTSRHLYGRRFDGVAWRELGGSTSGQGISGTPGPSRFASLACQASGEPAVAWQEGEDQAAEIYARVFDGSQWVALGDSGASSGGVSHTPDPSESPTLAIGAQDQTFVIWREEGPGAATLQLRQLSHGAWLPVADALSTAGVYGGVATSDNAALAVDALGRPVVAWRVDGSYSEIFVSRLEDERWQPLGRGTARGGGVSDTPGYALRPSLAMGPGGVIGVAWQERLGDSSEIFAKVLSQGAWVELGQGAAADGGVSDTPGDSLAPTLILSPQGQWVLAWHERSDGGAELRVVQLEADQWIAVGAPIAVGPDTGTTANPSLAVDTRGAMTVAWSDKTGLSNALFLRQYDGVAWQELGQGSAQGGGISGATTLGYFLHALAARSTGGPCAAWTRVLSPGVVVKCYEGGAWTALGGTSSVASVSYSSTSPALAVDDQDRVTVAWRQDDNGPEEIYAMHFDGSSWVELASSATPGGLSHTGFCGDRPALTIDAEYHPVVAWRDQSDGQWQIYARRFDGVEWRELAPGSATGGGVSHSAAASYSPSVQHSDGLTCVAWSERGAVASEILVRCTLE